MFSDYYDSDTDPYIDPQTGILRNKHGLVRQDEQINAFAHAYATNTDLLIKLFEKISIPL